MRCTAIPEVFRPSSPASSSSGRSRMDTSDIVGLWPMTRTVCTVVRYRAQQVDDLGPPAVVEVPLVVHLGRGASGSAWASATATPCQVCRVRVAVEQITSSGRSRSSASQAPAASASAVPTSVRARSKSGSSPGVSALAWRSRIEGPHGHAVQLA